MILHDLFNSQAHSLFEGGNIWPDQSEGFDQKIAENLAEETNKYLQGLGVHVYLIGSCATPTPGKISGDLDVMADAIELQSKFKTADPKETRQQLELYLQKKGLKTRRTGVTVHILLPYKGKFYQVDIKLVKNAEKVSKFHIHTLPAGSPYKGVHKQLMMNDLATSQGMLWSPDEGLYARDANGKKAEFLSDDPDVIAKKLIGPDATAKDLGSTESILAAIKDPARRQKMLAMASSSEHWQHDLVKSNITEAIAPAIGRKYQHIEDLVFTNGSVGGLHAVERLREMATEGKGIELKWDASPVLYWGRDNKGKFHMFPKNAVEYIKRGVTITKTGAPTMMNSPADVQNFIAGTGDAEDDKKRKAYAKNLAGLWPYFEKISPAKGYFEGGLLFWPSNPAVLNAKTKEYDFKPNVTEFHIPSNSELGKKIKQAKIMVAVTGYYAYIGAEEERYDAAEKLSNPDVIVQGTTYVENAPKIDTSAIDSAEAYIKQNRAAIDTFIQGVPGIAKPGQILYKFFNQQLRIQGVQTKFDEWAKANLSPAQSSKVVADPNLKIVLTAVEKLTLAKSLLINTFSMGTHNNIRQTNPEGYVQAHSGKKYKNDLPGQFVKLINQQNWNPKMKVNESLTRTGPHKKAVVGWGRGMGHKGHMFLAGSVMTHARETGADPYFVLSRTVGKNDPLLPQEKLQIYQKVFPGQHIFFTATDEMPDLTRVLSKLQELGYTDVTVVVGADQVKELSYVKNYNGKANKAGEIPYTFNSLNVISRQQTNDPSKTEEGPRATSMREILKDLNATADDKFKVWRDAMHSALTDKEVRNLMKKVAGRMNVPIEEAAGVGVVKKSKDPRYVMSTSKDVKANILQKEMKAMKLAETAIVQFHDKLNPKFWEHGKLKTEVAEHLKAIAAYFINDVNVEDLDILDITISGSNAAYTYTPKSDLDLHIIVHVDKDNADLLQNFFNTKRSLFNKNHNISLHGAPVELYIQMDTEEHTSSGLYSLLKNKWLDIPKKVKATIEDTTVKAKYARIVKRIKKVIEDNDLDSANLLTKKIFNYRQAGLDKHGEFGVENLTFKMLRKNEWIDKLIDFKTKFVDKKLSIKPE